MYKPKKETQAPNTNRLRLDVEPKLPSVYTIEQQFMEAKSRRGCLVEMPWNGLKANQLFILSVKWDAGVDLPIWTLYEQNNMESKMHWSEQYPPGDLQIMYDVVTMTVSGGDPAAQPAAVQIPESLRPKEFPQPTHASAAPAGAAPMPMMPPAGIVPPPAPMMPPQYAAPGYPPQQAPPGFPPQQPQTPPGYPQMPPQAAAPYPVDPAAAAAAAAGYPYGYYQQQQQQQPAGYPQQGAPPPGWGYGAPQQMPAGAPASPPQGAPQPSPGEVSGSMSTVDYSLISKRSKMQLGKLLVDSRIISQATLDAALKIQELVEDGAVQLEQAPSALGSWHTKGSAIGEYVNLPAMEVDQPEEKKRAKIGEIPEVSKLPISPPKSAAEARGAFDLLKKSGILTDEDIKAASEVRRKHGGDIIQILQSAGKLDKYTFESALSCLPLIELGLMKMEQVCIAIQYCCRMHVDFDTGLSELGWQNPRKLRSDLKL